MELQVAVLSKQGGRSRNEDACGFWTSNQGCCWVLSDGAGGHGGGDVASKTVVGTIVREFSTTPVVAPGAIAGLIMRANTTLLAEQQTRSDLSDMRATVAMLVIDAAADVALWGHLGDSRVYLFRGGKVVSQTRDHSVMQSMVDAGFGDSASLRHHPQRSVLLYALGSADEMAPTVTEAPLTVRDGDVFLMCSDGLWEYVEESAMERLLGGADSPDAWLAALESEVLRNVTKADHDNYSAIAVWAGDVIEATRYV